jgi:outer membrane protein OmpA-like peptidoglycan-associated protein
MDSQFRRRRGLPGLISLAGLAVATLSIAPAGAQQVIAGKGSVTIDLGVLNQLGQPVAGGNQPNGQAPTGIYGQPAYNNTGQTYGGLQFPPQQYPVSTLTVQPPVGSTPYVPPAATASVPPAPASTASTSATASTAVTNSAATASTAGTPPPPPTLAATPLPTAPAPATGTETNTAAATTTTSTSTDTATTAPAVPAPAPLAATGTGSTAATTGTAPAAGTTDTSEAAATPPAAPPAPAAPAATVGTTTGSGTADTTAATGATGSTEQTQTASIPPAAATEGQVRIAFPEDSTEIPDAVKAQLDALAQKMASDDNIRIQLMAYASGTPETASRARRLSLARALAVRSYLIKQGVRSTRMDVRALGNNVEGSPADRVDIIPKAQ